MSLVDTDGRKIRIYYAENGIITSFMYSGSESPINNSYVLSVITAYHFNKANWARANLTGQSQTERLVEREEIINVMNRESGVDAFNDAYRCIYWNPSQGTKHSNGTTTSPATDFDHEADHANAFLDSINLSDEQEEMRVINGSEQTMALANGESNPYNRLVPGIQMAILL